MKKEIKVSTVKVAAEAEVIFLNSAFVSRVAMNFSDISKVFKDLVDVQDCGCRTKHRGEVVYEGVTISAASINRVGRVLNLLHDLMTAFGAIGEENEECDDFEDCDDDEEDRGRGGMV